jgi:uncharacterized protein (TIGR03435 family)
MLKIVWLCLIVAGIVDAGGPEFEVASIKPSNRDAVLTGRQRQGMTTHRGRVDIGGTLLISFIHLAFRIQENQVVGPDWLRTEMFDISAKLPQGASEEQIPEMLQSLLVDRFKLVVHRIQKEQTVLTLGLGKGNVKLDRSAISTEDASDPNPESSSRTAVTPFGGGQVRSTQDPKTRGALLVGSRIGRVRMTPSNGAVHVEATAISMIGLADLLTELLRRQVFDLTGMDGQYHLVFDIPRPGPADDANRQQLPSEGLDQGMASAPISKEDLVSVAIQKLGLHLDSRKMPVEVIVVDRMERRPSGN